MNTEPTTEMMNEVIALFNGYRIYDWGLTRCVIVNDNKDSIPVSKLDYHVNWGTLMPVYHKVREKAFELKDDAKASLLFAKVMEQLLYGTIADVHLRIYQFITWHNQQKQTNEQRD